MLFAGMYVCTFRSEIVQAGAVKGLKTFSVKIIIGRRCTQPSGRILEKQTSRHCIKNITSHLISASAAPHRRRRRRHSHDSSANKTECSSQQKDKIKVRKWRDGTLKSKN